MPCLGSRKKKNGSIRHSEKPKGAISTPGGNGDTAVMAQMKQDCTALKLKKNEEHIALISRQSEELAALRQEIESGSKPESIETRLAELNTQHQHTLTSLEQKEALLQEKQAELEKLNKEKSSADVLQSVVAEKDRLLEHKENEIKELQQNWQNERAELLKPALEGVSSQLEQLKRTNEDAHRRLEDKENELSELRAELNRRERTPSHRKGGHNGMADQQKRLNRLTVDLENDRLMIQKLDELNQQLEAQKEQHEATLNRHAEVIAEKNRELVEHQQSLSDIKTTHHHSIKSLERNLQSSMAELKHHHEEDLKKLKLRLGHAERQAKSDMNSEVEKLLHEFEQSEHTHTQKLADLQKIHHEQLSVMKQDQQAEIQHHLKKRAVSSMIQPDSSLESTTSQKQSTTVQKSGGSSSKVLRWPAMGSLVSQPELIPKDPRAIHVYISSISANSAVKRNQESVQTLLTSCNFQFQIIDVARREPALQHMRRQTSGKTLPLPLIFVGGQYKGQLDDLIEARDSQRLSEFLSKGSEKRATASSTNSDTLTLRNTSTLKKKPILQNDEDESLLRELEKELASNRGMTLDF